MSVASDLIEQIEKSLGASWLPRIYRTRILKIRTRAYRFAARSKTARPVIQHTLLGIELKVGRQRMLCPDLATARYLAAFARIGCRDVAIPYDITQISRIADEVESSWQRMLLMADDVTHDCTNAFRTRLKRQLIGKVREEIAAAGAGTRIPEFKRSTRQNRESQKSTKETKYNRP